MNKKTEINSVRYPLSFDRFGSGRITAGDETAACEWTCSQRFDGGIIVRCKLIPGGLEKLRTATRQANEHAEWIFEERGMQFEGQAADGGTLRLQTVDFVLSPDQGEVVFHVAQAAFLERRPQKVTSGARFQGLYRYRAWRC